MITRYEVIDTHTKQVIGSYGSRKRATNRADKLDLEYGAVRYIVKPIFDTPPASLQPPKKGTGLLGLTQVGPES